MRLKHILYFIMKVTNFIFSRGKDPPGGDHLKSKQGKMTPSLYTNTKAPHPLKSDSIPPASIPICQNAHLLL